MFESLILGAVQGIAEWLPISSEAMIILVKSNFFNNSESISSLISFAIFLHFGTLLSVLVYFRKKIAFYIKSLFLFRKSSPETQSTLVFIIVATIVSGVFGSIFFSYVKRIEHWFANELYVNLGVVLFLCITTLLLYIAETREIEPKQEIKLGLKKSIITGLFQSFSVIPGVSRSGSTISGMALLGIKKERALELSFLLSIPIVIGANIVLNFDTINHITINHITALISAFIFGTLTISVLLKFVKRVRFSFFVGMFAFALLLFTLFL